MTPPENDNEYQDRVITSANPSSSGWTITFEDGWSFYVPSTSPIEPRPGMTARLYGGRCLGYVVRGLFIDGREVYYRTVSQQQAKDKQDVLDRERKQRDDFEKDRADIDARYDKLPECFQRRIDKFRNNNPDFRWKFEGYELFCCEQAVVIAEAMKSRGGEPIDELKAFHNMDWKDQKAAVAGLSDDHSGNTFGCAYRLAGLYISGNTQGVVQLHGALAPLVGSKDYGCVPCSEVS